MKIRIALKQVHISKNFFKRESSYFFLSDVLSGTTTPAKIKVLQYTRLGRYKSDIFEELNAIYHLWHIDNPQAAYEQFLDDVYDCFYIPVKYKIQFAKLWLSKFK